MYDFCLGGPGSQQPKPEGTCSKRASTKISDSDLDHRQDAGDCRQKRVMKLEEELLRVQMEELKVKRLLLIEKQQYYKKESEKMAATPDAAPPSSLPAVGTTGKMSLSLKI